MVTNMISLIIALFLASSSIEGSDTRKFDDFLNGRWTVDSTNNSSSLASISFVEGNTLNFTWRTGKGYPVMIMQSYTYTGIDAKAKKLSLNVYTKDLFSDKQQQPATMIIEVIDQDVILLLKGKEELRLKRATQPLVNPI